MSAYKRPKQGLTLLGNAKKRPISTYLHSDGRCRVGRSEKYKSCNFQKAEEDSEPRHSTDFRTVFGIVIGRFVFC